MFGGAFATLVAAVVNVWCLVVLRVRAVAVMDVAEVAIVGISAVRSDVLV